MKDKYILVDVVNKMGYWMKSKGMCQRMGNVGLGRGIVFSLQIIVFL